MPRLLRPAALPWPALLAVAMYGLSEWLALTRSRALDRLARWRREHAPVP